MSQGSPPRMKIARLFPAEYPWFFETHHKYLWGFGEHRSKKWLLPSSLLDSQAISVRRVKPTTHYGCSGPSPQEPYDSKRKVGFLPAASHAAHGMMGETQKSPESPQNIVVSRD